MPAAAAYAAIARIAGDRPAAIARAVLEQPVDALLAQDGDHHGGPAVLEASRRSEPFELEQRGSAAPFALDQRGEPLAQRDRTAHGERQGGGIAPDRGLRAVDLVPVNSP